MTIPHGHHRAEQFSFDDLETTEPDLRLADIDFLPDEEDDQDAALAFMEAKTEPARPFFADFADTLRDDSCRGPTPGHEEPRRGAARDEALLAFLETVRRVFGGNG